MKMLWKDNQSQKVRKHNYILSSTSKFCTNFDKLINKNKKNKWAWKWYIIQTVVCIKVAQYKYVGTLPSHSHSIVVHIIMYGNFTTFQSPLSASEL